MEIRIPPWVWLTLLFLAAGLIGWYWLYTQTRWDKDDLRDAVQQAAAELGKEPTFADTSLEMYLGQLIDKSGKGPQHGITPSARRVSEPDSASSAGDYEVTSHGIAVCMHVTETLKTASSHSYPATVNLSATVTDGTCPTVSRPGPGNGSSP
ncbi:hypothetical protein ACWGJX_41360 [Streptomyces sp. NPDC054775]